MTTELLRGSFVARIGSRLLGWVSRKIARERLASLALIAAEGEASAAVDSQ